MATRVQMMQPLSSPPRPSGKSRALLAQPPSPMAPLSDDLTWYQDFSLRALAANRRNASARVGFGGSCPAIHASIAASNCGCRRTTTCLPFPVGRRPRRFGWAFFNLMLPLRRKKC